MPPSMCYLLSVAIPLEESNGVVMCLTYFSNLFVCESVIAIKK